MPAGSDEVKEFYSSFPYPSTGLLGNYNAKKHSDRILRAAGLKSGFFKQKKVLEIGCGTGEISCSLAFNGARVTAVDFCNASLERAGKLAEKHNVKINFVESDLFELPEKLNEKFDLVLLIGVAHHTPKPKKVFEIACSFLKPNGLILLGLYNTKGRLKKKRFQEIISEKAGSDLKERVRVANELFCSGTATELQKIYLADKYCHPLEKTFSFKEALHWIELQGLEFIGCDPEIIKDKSLEESEKSWAEKGKSFSIIAAKKPLLF